MNSHCEALTAEEAEIKRRRGTRVLRVLGVVAAGLGLMAVVPVLAALARGGEPHEIILPWILAFNGLAGLATLGLAPGLFRAHPWAVKAAAFIAAGALLILGALAVHVATGAPHADRTVVAMSVRAGLWLFLALVARRAHACRLAVAG